ncbi:methylated-DNA--protein-cysteine methyltransferase [Escherichia coli]|nr:methylated-DNA--protein-cysteine methyltransferase [Escherichia coli]GHL49762.1 methylated-DNA--protein-cysteine methyltransferase [Escherichia coli]
MLRLLEEKIVTPLGPLWVICDEQFRLRAVEWEEYSERMVQLLDIHYRKEGYERISATNPGGLSDKLREYFAGNLSIIDTLPTATGGTPFQREVWKTLRTIPCGQVMHYGQLAEQLGRPVRRVPLVRQTDRIPSALLCLVIGSLAETVP